MFSISSDYLASFGNSLIVAGGNTVLVLLVSTLAAYSIEPMDWPPWAVRLPADRRGIQRDSRNHDGRCVVRDVSWHRAVQQA